MSEEVIGQIADIILDVCEKKEEVEALIDNVLCLIAELIDDEEWEPCIKDLKQTIKDNRDDEDLEEDVEEEHIEIVKDDDGFVSLK